MSERLIRMATGPEDDDGLIRSALDFEIRYLLKVDVTDPAA